VPLTGVQEDEACYGRMECMISVAYLNAGYQIDSIGLPDLGSV
jgi:hypothetical protein